MVKKRSLSLWCGLIFLAVLVIVGLFMAKPDYPPYTTYSPQADGTKAVFLLLNQEGLGASRLFDAVPEKSGLMIMLEPESNVAEQDWKKILEWVDQGNTLLLAGSSTNYIYSHLNYQLINKSAGLMTQKVSSADPLLKDVNELALSGDIRLRRHISMDFAYGDVNGAYLARKDEGKGRIIFLTVPDLFTNGEIDKKDNLILFLNIIRLYGQESIWFNEYAHGYTLEKSVRASFTWPLILVAIQLGLGTLLLYHFWGKRFGRPIPLHESSAEASAGYISSLANIYRQGRARHLTLENIYQGFRHDLAQYMGVPQNLSNIQLVKLLSGQPRVNAGKLEELLGRCDNLLAMTAISEKDLFDIAGAIEVWRQNNITPSLERRKKHGR